jgi:hypothetical protein
LGLWGRLLSTWSGRDVQSWSMKVGACACPTRYVCRTPSALLDHLLLSSSPAISVSTTCRFLYFSRDASSPLPRPPVPSLPRALLACGCSPPRLARAVPGPLRRVPPPPSVPKTHDQVIQFRCLPAASGQWAASMGSGAVHTPATPPAFLPPHPPTLSIYSRNSPPHVVMPSCSPPPLCAATTATTTTTSHAE